MSTIFADNFPNPYSSPRAAAPPQKAAAVAKKSGSVGIILAGLVLLMGGYFTSNLFLIGDLYHVGMGAGGKEIPSPFAAAFTTAPQQWGMYVACAAAFVAGAVMIGSQPFNPMAVVCYVMCPLVGMIYLIASPLRIVKKYAEPVAALYLLIGSCLFITGATQLFRLYGQTTGSIVPVVASMMTEVGLALVVGAGLKFLMTGSSASANTAEEPIVVAELADAAVARS